MAAICSTNTARTAQKLYNELEFLKETLQNRVPQVTTHSENQIQVINKKLITKPNIPKPLPKQPQVCPTDCPGPLNSAACNYACMKPKTSAKTSAGTAWANRPRTAAAVIKRGRHDRHLRLRRNVSVAKLATTSWRRRKKKNPTKLKANFFLPMHCVA